MDNSSADPCPSTSNGVQGRENESTNPCQSLIRYTQGSEILAQINCGQLLMVNRDQRSGLILYKRFHTEFAGPGAAVGGCFDIDCQRTVSVGEFSLVYPNSHEERQKAFWTRRHWIRLTEQMTEKSVPVQRAQMLLTQFEYYFDPQTVAQIPDEALAGLVGVLPQTLRMVRQTARTPAMVMA